MKSYGLASRLLKSATTAAPFSEFTFEDVVVSQLIVHLEKTKPTPRRGFPSFKADSWGCVTELMSCRAGKNYISVQ